MEIASVSIEPVPCSDVERNEAILIGDDRLVRVYLKIRDRIGEVNDEYKTKLEGFKAQLSTVEAELLRRLHERGATQTKTEVGTAFIAETMTLTIADEEAYSAFVLAENDTTYYQKRAKVERVKEYMNEHDGTLPPGLSSFRQLGINVRNHERHVMPNQPLMTAVQSNVPQNEEERVAAETKRLAADEVENKAHEEARANKMQQQHAIANATRMLQQTLYEHAVATGTLAHHINATLFSAAVIAANSKDGIEPVITYIQNLAVNLKATEKPQEGVVQ